MTSDYDEASKTNRRNMMYEFHDWDEGHDPRFASGKIFLVIWTAFFAILFLVSVVVLAPVFVQIVGAVLCLGLTTIWWICRSKPTGNAAFDNHIEDSIEGLKKEKRSFVRFMKEETEAKDAAAFKKFMERDK